MPENKEPEKIQIKKMKEMIKKRKKTKGVNHLNSSNFEEFIKNAKIPIIVDFWAE